MKNKMKDYNQEYFYVKKTRGDIYPTLAYAAGGGNYVEVDKAKPLDTSKKLYVLNPGLLPNLR